MTFTKKPPTTPGFYAWRRADDCVFAVKVYEHASILYSGGVAALPISECGGEWCRLVPSEEVQKAYSEGWMQDESTGVYKSDYKRSRAKRVAEGKEL